MEEAIPDAFFDHEGRVAVERWRALAGAAGVAPPGFDETSARMTTAAYLTFAADRVSDRTGPRFPIGAPPLRRSSANIVAAEDGRARALHYLREACDGARRAAARRRAAREDRRLRCVVCRARTRELVLACWHCVACGPCSAGLRTCPVCARPAAPLPASR